MDLQVRDVVVHLAAQRDAGGDSGAAYAIGLARVHGCAITALVLEIAPTPLGMEGDETRSTEAVPEEVRRTAQRIANAFATKASAAGIGFDTVAETCFDFSSGEVLADYARVRDLAVLAAAGRMSRETRLLAEAVLFGSGRPLVLVPARKSEFAGERITIAWDATPAAVHAIAGAMPFLEAAREVVVTSITDDKPFRPGQSGVELCRHLSRHGIAATFEAVERGERPVAQAILDAAKTHAAELLVMGGYAHSTLRGLIFGSATRGILDAAFPLPILMAH
jgi:nucleotide-binding universal stress UspA family protein